METKENKRNNKNIIKLSDKGYVNAITCTPVKLPNNLCFDISPTIIFSDNDVTDILDFFKWIGIDQGKFCKDLNIAFEYTIWTRLHIDFNPKLSDFKKLLKNLINSIEQTTDLLNIANSYGYPLYEICGDSIKGFDRGDMNNLVETILPKLERLNIHNRRGLTRLDPNSNKNSDLIIQKYEAMIKNNETQIKLYEETLKNCNEKNTPSSTTIDEYKNFLGERILIFATSIAHYEQCIKNEEEFKKTLKPIIDKLKRNPEGQNYNLVKSLIRIYEKYSGKQATRVYNSYRKTSRDDSAFDASKKNALNFIQKCFGIIKKNIPKLISIKSGKEKIAIENILKKLPIKLSAIDNLIKRVKYY
jgi:hypothetical protein